MIVSTATVALQQQLDADLAAIASLAVTPVRTAIVNGRSRYLCDRNLAPLSGEDPDQLGLDLGGDSDAGEQWPFKPLAEEREAGGALRAARGNAMDTSILGYGRPPPACDRCSPRPRRVAPVPGVRTRQAAACCVPAGPTATARWSW